MVFDELSEDYPHFVRIARHLEETSALFMTRPLQQLKASRPDYAFAEKLGRDAYALCAGREDQVLELAESLVEFSMEFLYLQRKLDKTGRYLHSTFKEVEEHVYRDPERKLNGAPYMWALYFTQAFWITHGRAWTFFFRDFVPVSARRGRVLEVPSGNGLFLANFLRHNSEWSGVAVDLSETAVEFTDRVLAVNDVRQRVDVQRADFFRFTNSTRFDRIICGEFLEHVEDPPRVLRKLRDHLTDDGRVFITAAVWAANIDHIYLYKSAQEVRNEIEANGFEIERELVQNVFPDRHPDEEKTPINFSAILRAR